MTFKLNTTTRNRMAAAVIALSVMIGGSVAIAPDAAAGPIDIRDYGIPIVNEISGGPCEWPQICDGGLPVVNGIATPNNGGDECEPFDIRDYGLPIVNEIVRSGDGDTSKCAGPIDIRDYGLPIVN